MIIRPNLPSHGAVTHTHTRIHARSKPHHDRSSSFFPPHIPFHPLTAWKRLDRPQAGSRGKNASLLIIQYPRDAPGERERNRVFTSTRRLESVSPARRKELLSLHSPSLPPSRRNENLRSRNATQFVSKFHLESSLFEFFPLPLLRNTFHTPRVARNVKREREREVLQRLGARGQLEIVPNNRGTRWTVHSYLAGWISPSPLLSAPIRFYLRIPR